MRDISYVRIARDTGNIWHQNRPTEVVLVEINESTINGKKSTINQEKSTINVKKSTINQGKSTIKGAEWRVGVHVSETQSIVG